MQLSSEEKGRVEANRPKLRKAFADLRKAGYLARQNFSCCSNCAGVEMTQMAAQLVADGVAVRGCVFYHHQGAENLSKYGKVYLAFGPLHHHEGKAAMVIGIDAKEAGEEIVLALRRYGLTVEWNGDGGTRIKILMTI